MPKLIFENLLLMNRFILSPEIVNTQSARVQGYSKKSILNEFMPNNWYFMWIE